MKNAKSIVKVGQEDGLFVVSLKVGSQKFKLGYESEEMSEAKWMAKMLAVAIQKIQLDAIGEKKL